MIFLGFSPQSICNRVVGTPARGKMKTGREHQAPATVGKRRVRDPVPATESPVSQQAVQGHPAPKITPWAVQIIFFFLLLCRENVFTSQAFSSPHRAIPPDAHRPSSPLVPVLPLPRRAVTSPSPASLARSYICGVNHVIMVEGHRGESPVLTTGRVPDK